MIVREGTGLEILIVKRIYQIDFFSRAMVFSGGKVEPQDADIRWSTIAAGCDRVPEEERGPRMAVLQEPFEGPRGNRYAVAR